MEGSIEDRAGNGEGYEPETELFPMGSVYGDEGVTIKTLIRAGMPVQFTVSMSSAEVPASGTGLQHPEREGALLVRYETGKTEILPVREGDAGQKKLTGWKARQTLRPVHVQKLDSNADDVEAGFALLMDEDLRGAGELLERLQRRLTEILQTA